jgi:DNA-binding MarR family transcriptional regulator
MLAARESMRQSPGRSAWMVLSAPTGSRHGTSTTRLLYRSIGFIGIDDGSGSSHSGWVDDARAAAERFAHQFPAVYLRFHRRDGKMAGLTAASKAVLEHLALAGPVTVGELSSHLDRSQSVVSDIVSHLEGAGFLERQDAPADRRRRLVWLSPAGRELLERDRDVLSIKLLERAFAAMTRDQRRALVESMEALLRGDDVAAASRPTLPTHPQRSPRRKELS